MRANFIRDIFASVTDVIGGRSSAYEDKLAEGRRIALDKSQTALVQWGLMQLLVST